MRRKLRRLARILLGTLFFLTLTATIGLPGGEETTSATSTEILPLVSQQE